MHSFQMSQVFSKILPSCCASVLSSFLWAGLDLSLLASPLPEVEANGSGLPYPERRKFYTIVFMGTSVSEHEGKPTGYVGWFRAFYQKAYPDVKTKIVSTHYRGAGSGFAAQRLERDVLPHDPDVVVCELRKVH